MCGLKSPINRLGLRNYHEKKKAIGKSFSRRVTGQHVDTGNSYRSSNWFPILH